ncbi:winged helix-turn-helix domain-containing protein [Ensifer aridi]|uniref:winged helix-turn-helix domain-containing protein n=1 Tax=Ensifer aridi TaxID=1708715 RepID=UPI001FCCCA81|nr:winged helix-turn-helix domain-containing protein [Ensifer aridi]
MAIVVTNPRQMTTASKPHCSATLRSSGGTSALGRLLSQFARAGVEKTVILALKSAGDLARNFGNNLYGMELSLRVLPTPNQGRLIDALSVKEIDEVCGDVFLFTKNLSIDSSVIDQLVQSGGNLVVAGKADSPGSLRILTNKSRRFTATFPGCPRNERHASADLSPFGIYKFEATFLRSVARNRPHRSNDDLEFFEAALGLQRHGMHVIHGESTPRESEKDSPTITLAAAATSDYSRSGPASPTQKLLTFRDLEVDMNNYRVRRNGRIVHLTPTALRLLNYFIRDPHRVCSRDELKQAVWPDTIHVGPRTVDVHIGHLRAALNKVGQQDFIRTVRSVGYALSE